MDNERVVIQYSVKNGQLVWSGKTDRSGFAGIMANGMNDLNRFCEKKFPGKIAKLVRIAERKEVHT